MIRSRNILLISPEPWDHIFVSKHHYAVHLAKRGNKVYFLNPPGQEQSVNQTVYQNVFEVRYRAFPSGFRFYPASIRRTIIKRKYVELTALCQAEFHIVWSFDNSVFFDFSALPQAILKISHIVDLNQNFQTRRAASTADYCFCTTELIKQRLLAFNNNVTKINHGLNPPEDHQTSAKLFSKKRTALYAGNLAMPYIDWIILNEIVSNNPDVDFIFVGPNEGKENLSRSMADAKQAVMKSRNTRCEGRIAAGALQSYYRSVDVLLIAYQDQFHNDQANPHKMMEYLGSGKMVLATFTGEYVDLAENGLILMSKRNSDFSGLFNKVLHELQYWNSEPLVEARRHFALDNTYEKQIERIEKIISRPRE